jgi:very-short-patch-repair endonuclease
VIEHFIVDFYCPAARLVIEVDGPIHDLTPEEDAARQQFLEATGLHVLRFTNDQILQQPDIVLASIREIAQALTMTPSPPAGRGQGEGYD